MAVIERIACRIGKGCTEEQACVLEGISVKSFDSAKRRNPQFAGVVKKRQAEFIDNALDVIADGGMASVVDGKVIMKPWTGLAWILERRHRAQFARLEAKSEAVSSDGTVLSQEQIDDLGRIARKLYVTHDTKTKSKITP